MKLVILLISMLGIVIAAYPQSRFQYTYYTEKDGMSNNIVSDVLMDRDGFIWVGTRFGLNRFDGNAFENFYNSPSDTNSIADNTIQKLFLDDKNRLWIGTNAGISLYHPLSRSFSNYAPDTGILKEQGISFGALCSDNNGNIWVGTKNDLLVFTPSDNKFTSTGWNKYAAAVAPANGNHVRIVVLGLVKKSGEELWVLTTYGLFSVNTRTREFNYYSYPGMTDYYGCQLNYADNEGNVWISTFDKGILAFNNPSGKWTNYRIPPAFSAMNNASSIVRYEGDTLVYCSYNTVVLFDATRKKMLSKIDYDAGEANAFKNAECKTIKRLNHRLWLGTNKGLVKIASPESIFHFIPVTSSENIGRVFRLSNNDAILFTGLKDVFTTFIKRKDKPAEPLLDQYGARLHCSYQYLAESPGGHCYLNSDEGFYKYDGRSNTVTGIPLPEKINPTSAFYTRNIVIDREGGVWVRTLGQGIMKYDTVTGKLSIAREIPVSGKKELNALYYDSLTHTLWIAEEFNGVFVFDIATKQTRHYALSMPGSRRKAAIVGISGDGRGNIWLSDLESGLVEYNYGLNKFIRYTVYDGLPSNNCAWTVFDVLGILWINTDIGLSKYNPNSHKFTNYTEKEGYSLSPGNYMSADSKGNICLASKNGYYTWNNRELKDPVKEGTLYLRDILLLDKHLAVDTSYLLSYKENSIRLLFGLLSYDNREMVSLEYSLNGNSWITTGIQSYISFANLAPGKYDLYVGIKNEQIRKLHIRFIITAPFWQKSWFFILLLAGFIVSVLLISRNRLKVIRKESDLRQRITESEMSALRSQMNPHFIFNTLNSINSYIIENKKDEASDYLTDFSRLIRIILEHSQKRSVTLKEELSALKLYLELESRRLEASFDYSIAIPPEIDPAAVYMPPLIIQPFVENAIWHGLRGKKTGGHIEIKVEKQEEGLLITVGDDGVGRLAAGKLQKVKEGNSFGTAATIQRISLNEPGSKVKIEDLYDDNGNAAGTMVSIYLTRNNK